MDPINLESSRILILAPFRIFLHGPLDVAFKTKACSFLVCVSIFPCVLFFKKRKWVFFFKSRYHAEEHVTSRVKELRKYFC